MPGPGTGRNMYRYVPGVYRVRAYPGRGALIQEFKPSEDPLADVGIFVEHREDGDDGLLPVGICPPAELPAGGWLQMLHSSVWLTISKSLRLRVASFEFRVSS